MQVLALSLLNIVTWVTHHTILSFAIAGFVILLTCLGFILRWLIKTDRKERLEHDEFVRMHNERMGYKSKH